MSEINKKIRIRDDAGIKLKIAKRRYRKARRAFNKAFTVRLPLAELLNVNKEFYEADESEMEAFKELGDAQKALGKFIHAITALKADK